MKKLMTFILCLIMCSPLFVNAEEFDFDIVKNFGGNDTDYLSKAISIDDGFIAVGYTSSTDINGIENKGSCDTLVVKYDKEGNVNWYKSWGGDGSDTLRFADYLSDGSIIVGGSSSSTNINGQEYSASSKIVVLKYDKDGNLIWQRIWGGNKENYFNKMFLQDNGDLYIVGSTRSTDINNLENKGLEDAILLKYDKDGNLLYQNSFGGNGSDRFNSICFVNDGLIAIGYSHSTNIEGLQVDDDGIAVKYNLDGELIWKKNFKGDKFNFFEELIYTEKSEFVLIGRSSNYVYLNKYDLDGNLIFEQTFGGDNIYVPDEILITDNGEIFISISSLSVINEVPNFDTFIVKYSSDGKLLWEKEFKGLGEESMYSFVHTKDNGIILLVNSDSTDSDLFTNKGSFDALILRYDKDGNLIWKKHWGGSDKEYFMRMFLEEYNNLYIFGYSQSTDIEGISNKGDLDFIFLKGLINYDVETSNTEFGTYNFNKKDNYGLISAVPNEGYEVDKVIVKDKNGSVLDVELTKLEDGTYSFPLYTDVSVEVLFKEILTNPKTGVFNPIVFIPAIVFLIMCVYFIKSCEKSYEI